MQREDWDRRVVLDLQPPAEQRAAVLAHDRSNLDGNWGGPQDPAVLPTPG